MDEQRFDNKCITAIKITLEEDLSLPSLKPASSERIGRGPLLHSKPLLLRFCPVVFSRGKRRGGRVGREWTHKRAVWLETRPTEDASGRR